MKGKMIRFATRARGITKTVLLIALCMLIPAAGIPVRAETEILNLDKNGSLAISFTYNGKPINDGNKVGLYKVADVVEDNGFKFVFRDRFKSAGKVPEDLDAVNAKLAEKLEKIVKDNKYSPTAGSMELDSKGNVMFTGLKPGLYLVVHTKKVQTKLSDGKKVTYTIKPFLVSIPQMKDGKYIYDVSTKPKVSPEKDKEGNKKSKEPEKKYKRLPQTGQLWWPVMLLGAAGAVCLVFGLFRKRKED